MIGAIIDRVEKYLGRGRHSIAVPVMDGPLHPNNRLEEAQSLFSLKDVDNLACVGANIWCSSGPMLLCAAQDRQPEVIETLKSTISAIAASPEGALAIGVDGQGIVIRGGKHDRKEFTKVDGVALNCPTAIVFTGENTIAVCNGSKDKPAADWKRDLMAHGKSGSVWEIDLVSGKATKIAGGLAFPYGLCRTSTGYAVSEAWAHRIIAVKAGEKPRELLRHLPGYPARLSQGPNGGYLLAVFAPRNQLVEFVLREPEFLSVMTRTVHPDNWIGPKLMWGQGFKEPMQGAALKTMGIIKPWAPTWSYGLLVVLDEEFQPIDSYHSRADGRRHGVTSVTVRGQEIIAAAKGAHEAVVLHPITAGGAQ